MYLFIDTETGGLDPSTDILEAYFHLTDEKLNEVDTLHLYCKPNNGLYTVDPKALEINGINLVEHDKIAKTYDVCKQELYDFLKRNSTSYGGASNIIPIGNNVFFDIEKIQRHWLSKGSMDTLISYRVIDLKAIWMYLQVLGIIPADKKASAFAMAEYLEIPKDGDHTAKGDVLVDIKIFKRLIEIGQGKLMCGGAK